ncbi:MAG: DUF4139 domain-containing protein [Bacteroidia bacterium]|nr:DUF4139 domain-containing protein [Bacteroidia bacterium]
MKTGSLTINFSKRRIIATIIGICLFTSTANVLAGSTEKNIKSKIESVTVFTSGAQVYRSSAVNVAAGITTLVFENLEAGIDPRSIQAGGAGNFVIMDVQHLIKYPELKQNTDGTQSPKNLRHIKLLQDSLVMIGFDLEEIYTTRDALNIEKNALLNNRLIKGETKRDTLNLVKESISYLRERLNNINSELLKLKKEEYRVNNKKQRMQNDLVLLQNYNANTGEVVKDETKYQIIVTVSADAIATGSININYMLQGAGWSPSYDLRAKGASGTMQLTYKAQVFQNTGIDWNDVKLTLSTANPNQSNVKPLLNTWWLSFYNPNPYRYPSPVQTRSEAPSAVSKTAESVADYESDKAGAPMEEVQAQQISDYITTEENFTNVEYEIKLPYTIPNDGKSHFVAVQTKDIAAEYAHFSAPKLDKDAFLVAKITNWDELNLVAGNVNIYFDGTFVGESYINPNNLTDTLDLTLGRDKNIVVTRVKQKDKTKEKTIGEEKVKTVTYEITVRNTKSTSSNFYLQDQIPVSQNKELVILLVESSGATLDENSGLLNWKLNIKPKETKKITFTYSVKYPKTKIVAGL